MHIKRHIGVFPAWDQNPYLNILYMACRARGYKTIDTTTYSGALETLGKLNPGDVFHLHWTAPIIQKSNDASEARIRLERFMHALEDSRTRGVIFVWTIHNVLPHDARYVDIEIELCRRLADHADLIHVLTPSTTALTAPYYLLPSDRISHVPHPSYQGIYDTGLDRRAARSSFGLKETDRAVLFFGQMRPYKGLDTLFGAIDDLDDAEAAKTVLLIAGRTLPEDRAELERILPRRTRVIRDHSFIDDADVARWFRAADIAIFPYRNILNSGSLHLAATFGLRACVPDQPHLQQAFGNEDWVKFIARERPRPSIRAAIEETDPTKVFAPTTSAAFCRRLSPWSVSTMFADLLDANR